MSEDISFGIYRGIAVPALLTMIHIQVGVMKILGEASGHQLCITIIGLQQRAQLHAQGTRARTESQNGRRRILTPTTALTTS